MQKNSWRWMGGLVLCALLSGTASAVSIREINEQVLHRRRMLPPLAYEGFKILTINYVKEFRMAGRVIDPELTARLFNLAPEERVLGSSPFRTGSVLYTSHAVYWIGENTFREFFGLRVVPPMEFESKSDHAFRTRFYCVMPLSDLPEVHFKEISSSRSGEEAGGESWMLQLPDGQELVLDFNTFKVFTEVMQDILANYSFYEKRLKEKREREAAEAAAAGRPAAPVEQVTVDGVPGRVETREQNESGEGRP